MATVILGRDGMGDAADEDDFDAWVAYVTERIDAASGLDVDVQTRGARDVQSTGYPGAMDDEAQTLRDALVTLWADFCADDSAWPKRGA